MQPHPELSDWSVLSQLLRCARREGWEVLFLAGRIEIVHPGLAPGVVALPALLLRQAREAGWQAVRLPQLPAALALRHPAVNQRIDLLIA